MDKVVAKEELIPVVDDVGGALDTVLGIICVNIFEEEDASGGSDEFRVEEEQLPSTWTWCPLLRLDIVRRML